jgi:hypothetical protein
MVHKTEKLMMQVNGLMWVVLNSVDPRIRSRACADLVELARPHHHKKAMCDTPGLLDAMMRVATTDPCAESRSNACAVLLRLANDDHTPATMFSKANLVECLLHAMKNDDYELARSNATSAIMNLCFDSHIAEKMFPILDALMETMLADSLALTRACGALLNISASRTMTRRVFGKKGIVEALINVLENPAAVGVHEEACGTFRNLAVDEYNAMEMAGNPELIKVLLKLLHIPPNSNLAERVREEACNTFRNLSLQQEAAKRLFRHADVVSSFLSLAEHDRSIPVRQQICQIICNLLLTPVNAIKAKETCGTKLMAVLASLRTDGDVKIRESSFNILAHFCDVYPNSVYVFNHPGAMDGLIHAMASDSDRDVRAAACNALRSMASCPLIGPGILQHRGMLESLIALLESSSRRSRECACSALANIANSTDTAVAMLGHARLVQALLSAVDAGDDMTSICATVVIFNLSLVAERYEQPRPHFAEVVAALRPLLNESNEELAMIAACCIANLSDTQTIEKEKFEISPISIRNVISLFEAALAGQRFMHATYRPIHGALPLRNLSRSEHFRSMLAQPRLIFTCMRALDLFSRYHGQESTACDELVTLVLEITWNVLLGYSQGGEERILRRNDREELVGLLSVLASKTSEVSHAHSIPRSSDFTTMVFVPVPSQQRQLELIDAILGTLGECRSPDSPTPQRTPPQKRQRVSWKVLNAQREIASTTQPLGR